MNRDNSENNLQNYNHNRPLEDFQKELKIIGEHGFNPIAVTQMYFEETYVFETDEEAQKAYETLEKDETIHNECFGWWYGKEEFLKFVEEYESLEGSSKVLIHWL